MRKLFGVVALVAVIGLAMYWGYRDGREHQNVTATR